MKSITTMVNQLKKKFPDRNISIDTHHATYEFTDSVEKNYTLFPGDGTCKIKLSYDGLNKKVNELLGGE